MKREAHKAAVRANILGVARRLFLRKGYEQTTIRTIAGQADVRTGTIYHFFKNKEGVFEQIAVEAFQRVAKRVAILLPEAAQLERLACELAWHAYVMNADPKAAELYLITYNSSQLGQVMLAQHMARSESFYLSASQKLTELDYVARAMLVRGTMQSIAVRAHAQEIDALEPLLESCFTLLFRALDFEETEIRQALASVWASPIKTLVAEALEDGRMMG